MTGPIRVLQYIGGLGTYGGSQAYIMEVYRKMDRSKVQFDFVTFPDIKGGYLDEARSLGAVLYECPRYNGKNHRSFCQWWESFLISHTEYRIIHAHIRSCAAVYLPICKRHGLVTLIHSHSTSNGTGIRSLAKRIMQFPLRFEADYLFACSEIAGRWLYGERAMHSDKYRMIPNGIDIAKFQYDAKVRARVRAELGIGREFVVGHVGRFHEAKNHSYLLQIFSELCRITPSKLLLVGDGELRSNIEEQAKQLGIYGDVLFVGNTNHVSMYYNAMDVFAFPSKWEGLPVSVVEAQANALPVLLADTVTRDVDLTSYIHWLSIKVSPTEWVKKICSLREGKRGVLEASDMVNLNKFDSARCAQELQNFYLDQFKKDDRT